MVGQTRGIEVHVHVDGAGGCDEPLAVAHRGAGRDDQARVDPVHDRRVAGLAETDDTPVLDAEVALHDAEHGIDDEDVAEQEVEGPLRGGDARRHADAVAQGLSAAVQALVAVDGVVVLDHRDQRGVGEPHAVAGGRAVEGGVVAPWNRDHFLRAPLRRP